MAQERVVERNLTGAPEVVAHKRWFTNVFACVSKRTHGSLSPPLEARLDAPDPLVHGHELQTVCFSGRGA